MENMENFVQLVSSDEYILFVPRPVAELSEFIRLQLIEIEKKRSAIEETEMLKIAFPDIKGKTLEIVMDYLNHKYYYENLKDINLVINEDYHLEPETALDVLNASVKLQC